jgi:HSP20 family molecular chaperone IbpA
MLHHHACLPNSGVTVRPASVDSEKTSADCRAGVLRITMPKGGEGRRKQINVGSSDS